MSRRRKIDKKKNRLNSSLLREGDERSLREFLKSDAVSGLLVLAQTQAIDFCLRIQI